MSRNFTKTIPSETKIRPLEWGTLEWRVDDSLAEGTGISVAVMTLKPGKASPFHRHPNCHEFIYVVQGAVEAMVEGKKALITAGDSLLVPPGTPHGFKNAGPEDAKLVLSYSSGRRIYEEA